MKKIFLSIFLILPCSITLLAQTGCLVIHYDNPSYSKVFNNPTSAGSSVYQTGNGNNFIWWEGVCGTDTYVATMGGSIRSCSLNNGDTHTGLEYNVSAPFLAPCGVPIDDFAWLLTFVLGATGFFLLRRTEY
jgi:hypothetical protein